MRSGGLALLALAALSGCNQIFGLDPVVLVDAGPDALPIDAPPPTISLTAITPELGLNAQPTHQVEYPPLSPAPLVQYGLVGGPLTDTTYEDGRVKIPYEYPARTEDWRLVYTPDGGLPHEVHWHPGPDMGSLTELAPPDRAAIPAGAQLSLTPVYPSPLTFTRPRVYTTNAWSETRMPAASGSTVTVDYAASTTVSLLGPKRAVALNDDILLIDYIADANNGCQKSQGAAPFQVDLALGSTDSTPPDWSFQGTVYSLTATNDPSSTLALGYHLASSSDVGQYKVISLVSTDAIPLFQRTELGIPLPLPLGASLIECDMTIVLAGGQMYKIMLPSLDRPNDTSLLASATIQYALRRKPAIGPDVYVGYASTVTADPGITSYVAPFSVPLATDPTIDGTDVLVPEAFASSTPVVLTGTAPTASLAFTTVPASAIADFYEATLYVIQTSLPQPVAVPIREFTFHASPLVFDRDLLVPGQLYMFEVRGVVGAPNAAHDDFRVWSAQQSISRAYTQTFKR